MAGKLTRMTGDYDLAGKRVWVAGHRGMVGSALVRRLAREGCEMLTADRAEVDLRRQQDVEAWMRVARPQAVFIAAATVGGIHANSTRPAEFLYNNMAIESAIIHAAHEIGVEKLLFFASNCIYPRLSPQPMKEEYLLTGPLEPTNEWYALAKITGIKLCQAYRQQYGRDFISCIPANLYGPGDNYDPVQGHVLPAFLAKLHRAKQEGRDSVEIWGTGKPVREFMHVDDMADAAIHLIRYYASAEPINVGSGEGISIQDLMHLVADVIGYRGRFVNAPDKPDGMPVKLLDSSRMTALGWRPQVTLRTGLVGAYGDYQAYLKDRGAA